MDIEKLYDKLFGEPKRKREQVSVQLRLNYKEIELNNFSFWLVVAGMAIIYVSLWILKLIEPSMLALHVISILLVFMTIFQFKPRFCPSCKQKIIRQKYESHLYYFCDNCRVKYKSPIGADSW